MTVQKLYVKNKYFGDGANTVFPITFEWAKKHPESIQVWVRNNAGVLTKTDNFLLKTSSNEDIWNVVYPSVGDPLGQGETITIVRELSLLQVLNLVNQGPFFAEDVEITFDELVMMIQQLNEKLARSFKVAVDIDGENTFDTTVPIEPGKSFRVKDDGTGFEVTEDPAQVLPLAKSELEAVKREHAEAVQDLTVIKDEVESAKTDAQSAADVSIVTKGEIETIAGNYSLAKDVLENVNVYKNQAQGYATQAETAKNNAEAQVILASASAESASISATASAQSESEAQRYRNEAAAIVTPDGLAELVAEHSDEIVQTQNELKGLFSIEIGKNKLNPNELVEGILSADGNIGVNPLYKTTGMISVEAGKIVTASFFDKTTQANPIANMKYIMPFDADGNHLTLITTQTTAYTVPNGVSFVRASFNASNYANDTRTPQIELTTDGVYTPFEEYKETKVLDKNVVVDEVVKARGGYKTLGERLDDISSEQREKETLNTYFNLLDMTKCVDGFLQNSGIPTSTNPMTTTSTFFTSDFISAKKGDRLVCSYKTQNSQTVANINYIAEYDKDKKFIGGTYANPKTPIVDVVNDNTEYVRISVRCGTYGFDIKLEKNPFGLPTTYEIYKKYENLVQPKHCFLPKYIYCAVGRTIDVYNSQICLEAEKYHFQWICAKGIAMGRKFTITGTSNLASTRTDSSLAIGQHRLWLNIYDDNNNLVWQGASIICVGNALASAKTIVPIGDSLTNQKTWLSELMNLSSNISLLGTRTFSLSDANGNTRNGHHEGRSGWSAIRYTQAGDENPSDTKFTYANPFYNGTTFSMSYYVNNELGGNVPSAIQIYLGTNDVSDGVESAVANIKALVDSIRADYPTLKIMVVNTIYRSRQDGYGSIGADGYAGADGAKAYQFDEDIKVLELAKLLTNELLDMSNVYVIPLYATHDTEYNFGSNEVKANPRAIQMVTIPSESVHPQNQGYYQMADEMYSAYCVVL